MGKPIEAVLVKKGHQDDTVPYAVLSATAKHNVDADALASTLYRDKRSQHTEDSLGIY